MAEQVLNFNGLKMYTCKTRLQHQYPFHPHRKWMSNYTKERFATLSNLQSDKLVEEAKRRQSIRGLGYQGIWRGLITHKSDQISPGIFTRNIMKNLGLHSLLRWKMSCMRLAGIWSTSNFRPTRARFSTVWLLRSTQANSCQAVLLLRIGDCAIVVRQLNSFLASWLDLAVPFGHPPMQVLIL